MKNYLRIPIFILILLSSCKKDVEVTTDYVIGKNHYTTVVDNKTREYYVHIPSNYNENTPLPVVFMLHGSSGNGKKFYNISGWKEVGEAEGIITVYPSSGKYCIEQDGEIKNTTKWNVLYPNYSYCSGDEPLDDIKFLRKIVEELHDRFSIKSNNIYLVGFSNGGQMAFRCAVEMGDVFAAILESAGSSPTQYYQFNAIRQDMPISFQVGNSDPKFFGEGVVIPLTELDSLITTNPNFTALIENHTNTFNFENNYTITGDASILTATFKSDPFLNNRVFNIIFIDGLEHNYPNGINHPIMGAAMNWNWLKQYSLP